MSRQRVILVGGGFGGVKCAKVLSRRLSPAQVEPVLVNRENHLLRRKALVRAIVRLALIGFLLNPGAPGSLCAQPLLTYPPPPSFLSTATSKAQRNALNALRAQVDWLRNSLRTSSRFAAGSYGVVWRQFQKVRRTHTGFKVSLAPDQLAAGANDLAELDAGLDILQQVLEEYQQDLAAGRSPAAAFRDMARTLNAAVNVWSQELDQTARRLQVR